MAWNRIDLVRQSIGRPVLVRTVEGEDAIVAFLSPDGISCTGGALVQSSMTVLGATPTAWCEPKGEADL